MSCSRAARLAAGACACLLLGACALLAPGGQVSVVKSESDTRLFRYMELPNRLKVLLVSDPDAERAAASLDVHVGYRQDPPELPGLSHFLEHMLFLGTQRYPEADGWQAFVSKHGGTHNAYTSFEHTNYYFSVKHNALPEALDRFADFFVAPLFDENYVQRELQAVEAEYRARIDDEPRRIFDAFRQVINARHPLAKFSGGNLQTLAKPGIREALLAFYERWYGAERMALVISGPQSLPELEAMAVAGFAKIPARGTTFSPVEQPLLAAPGMPGAQVLAVKTRKPMRELQLSFPMPDMRAHSDSKALYYIGNVIGHEGNGSLLASLKRAGLVESIHVGNAFDYRGGSLYQINIGLSERGLAAVDTVVSAVFHVVAQLYQELQANRAMAASRFEEQRALADLHFRYYTPGPPVATVRSASANLHYYPPADVIYGDYKVGAFNEELVRNLLDRFEPANMLLVLAADTLPDRFSPTHSTEAYAAEYSLQMAPAAWGEAWQRARDGQIPASVAAMPAIVPPAANRFIPQDFRLYAADGPASFAPLVFAQAPGMEAWYKVDDEFEQPRADIRVAFNSPLLASSAQQQALSHLFSLALGEQLQQSIYPAYLAGYSASFYPTLRGFTLKVGGYNDKLAELFGEIVRTLPEVSVERQRFGELVAELERRWTLDMQGLPYQRLASIAQSQLYPGSFDRPELIAAIRRLNYEDLEAFSQAFWPSSFQLLLAHGNFDAPTLESLGESLAALPRCQCSRDSAGPPAITRLPTGTRVDSAALLHPDQALYWYFQSADKSMASVANAMLVAAILEPGLFAELRTRQQLGYVVSTSFHPLFDWPGLSLALQSPEHSGFALAAAVDGYLASFVADVDEASFIKHRSALVARLREADTNLHRRTARFWRAMMLEQDFGYREQLAAAMEATSFQQWRKFAQELLKSQHRRTLQLQTR